MGSSKRNAQNDDKQPQSPRINTRKKKRVKGAMCEPAGPHSDAPSSLQPEDSEPSTSSPENLPSARRLQWPGLLRTHLGILESHALTLEQLLQDIQAEAKSMSGNERRGWELDEKGEWQLICRMSEQANEVLIQARKVAKRILHKYQNEDRKELDPEKNTSERLESEIQAKAKIYGYNSNWKSHLHISSEDDSNSYTEESSTKNSTRKAKESTTSGSEIEDEIITNVDFLSLKEHSKMSTRKMASRKRKITNIAHTGSEVIEPNPYFMIDLNPTPVNMTETHTNVTQKSKMKISDSTKDPVMDRRTRLLERDRKKALRKSSSTEKQKRMSDPDVDFAALEAQLQAEIAASERHKRESLARIAALNAGKESNKKRRRSSEGAEAREKKLKKEKKRKSDESIVNISDLDKKRKKRKADDCVLDEKEAGIKKKRKHKR